VPIQTCMFAVNYSQLRVFDYKWKFFSNGFGLEIIKYSIITYWCWVKKF